MMLCILARSVHFVGTQEDLKLIASNNYSFVTSDLSASFDTPIQYNNRRLDCQGNTITVQRQLFSSILQSTMRNCVFICAEKFASSITSTMFINVSFVQDTTTLLVDTMQFSMFSGVQVHANSNFTISAKNSQFVGCKMLASVNVLTNAFAMFQTFQDSTLQNSYVQGTVTVKNCTSVGLLAITATNVSVVACRVISQLALQNSQSTFTDVGGFVMYLSHKSRLQDTDFSVAIDVNSITQNVGGIAARANLSNAEISNISCYFQFYAQIQNISSIYATEVTFGAIFGTFQLNETVFRYISAFLSAEANFTVANSNLYVGGLTGLMKSTNSTVDECYALGDIAVVATDCRNLAVAGTIGAISANHALEAINYYGRMKVSVASATEVRVGGLIGQHSSDSLTKSQANGNITLEAFGNATYIIGGVVGDSQPTKNTISYCISRLNMSIYTNYKSGSVCAACLASNATGVDYSVANCALTVEYVNGTFTGIIAGILLGVARGSSSFASAEGNITITSRTSLITNCMIAPLAATVRLSSTFDNMFVHGSITIPSRLTNISTAFGNISANTFRNIVIAVSVSGPVNKTNHFITSGSTSTRRSFYIDCDLTGNAVQDQCNDEITSDDPSFINDTFGWSRNYNNRYPYIKELPIYYNNNYLLASTGSFKTDYQIDSNGNPYPKRTYSICRGVCDGTYESPAAFTCTNPEQHCIRPSDSIMLFQNANCLLVNAQCNDSVSLCTKTAELTLTSDLYQCEVKCAQCQSGYCELGACFCDLYYNGGNCDWQECNADQPVCYGDTTLECNKNNSQCIVRSPCSNVDCGHGSCVETPDVHCVCTNHWTGGNCSECTAFGVNCEYTQAQCDTYCSGNGKCTTPQSTTCLCNQGFTGTNCSECAPNYFLPKCVAAKECGTTQCSGNGNCTGNASTPSCICFDYWSGSNCKNCSQFGPGCNISAAQCGQMCCEDIESCNQQCVGSFNSYHCECTDGFFGQQCNVSAQKCATDYCSGHGACVGGKNFVCACSGHWKGTNCTECAGFGAACDLSPETCAIQECNSHGTCQGIWSNPVCKCVDQFDPAEKCSTCKAGMTINNGKCYCGSASTTCGTGYFCSEGMCQSSCESIPYCQKCASPNFRACASCSNGFIPNTDGSMCLCNGSQCAENQYCEDLVCKDSCTAIPNCLYCDSISINLCIACGNGLRPNAAKNACVCSESEPQCGIGHYCLYGVCERDCTLLDANCAVCAAGDASSCAQCSAGYTLSNKSCERQTKTGPPIAVIAGSAAAAAVVIIAVIATIIVTRKIKNSKATKNTKVISEDTQQDSSLKNTPPPDDLVLAQPKPLKAAEAQDNTVKRKVKKIMAKRSDNLLDQLPPDYTGDLSQVRRTIKLEPIKQSGKDQLV